MRVLFSQLTGDGEREGALTAAPMTDADEMHAVVVYDGLRGRALEGLGGAATEAAAHTYFQMPQEQREAFLSLYFGDEGADYRFLRVSLDSCDFSIAHYEAMSDPTDEALVSFSLRHDEQEIIPFIKAAQKRAGRVLPLLLSPWSPPAFMKTNGERNHGGKLLPQFAPMWAEYICRYIKGYQAHGLQVRFVSVQNEPNATQSWDSCRYTAQEERAFVCDHLAPALAKHELNTEIFIWDHNKERVYDRAVETLSGEARALVSGIAFHLYTGDHFEALQYVRERFPEKTLMFSEGCAGIRGDRYEHAMRYAHEYIGDMRQDVTLFFDWNLCVNQQGGPNHVGNYCCAPVMFDQNERALTVNPSYRAIRLLSKVARPGAVRLCASAYDANIDAVAYEQKSGRVAVALLNRAQTTLPVNLHIKGYVASAELPARALTTLYLAED